MLNAAGLVVCGGKSRRMGRSKALLRLGNRTLLELAVATLQEVVQPVLIVAAPEQKLPPIAGAPVVRDQVAGAGPLQGIADGIDALPSEAPAAFVTAVDAPLLTPDWIRFLLSQLGNADIVVPVAEGRTHPLSAVYRPRVAATARRLLALGRRRPVFLFDEHPTVYVTENELRRVDPELRSLRNINTPAEFELISAEWTDPPS